MKAWETVFLAAAGLHRGDRSRAGFRGKEILEAVRRLAPDQREATVNAHIYLHCVANVKPNPATYRVLYRNPDGTFRLYREGDHYHPARRDGKGVPEAAAVPEQYLESLRWYGSDYAPQRERNPIADDPILALRGAGKEVWQALGGTSFIDSLRAESPGPPDFDQMWARVQRCAGEPFRTVRALPFTYRIEKDGAVRVCRDGHWIARDLPRTEFEKAWARAARRGPSYVFAILTDPRISG